jgi:hypothetical protein
MEKVWGSKRKRGKKLYAWGLLGLIPNVGVIAGLILFFRGIFQYKDKYLAIIGLSDILFTIVFWFAMIHLVFNGEPFRSLNKQLSHEQLNNKYWLFSVGLDGKPFTNDDFYPKMNPADSGKFGLMIR